MGQLASCWVAQFHGEIPISPWYTHYKQTISFQAEIPLSWSVPLLKIGYSGNWDMLCVGGGGLQYPGLSIYGTYVVYNIIIPKWELVGPRKSHSKATVKAM